MSVQAGAGTTLRGPVVAGIVGKAAEAVTLVLLATVVPRLLGPVDYGRFSVALTVVALGSVAMTLGGATLLARYVPAAPSEERPALARTLSLRLARNRSAQFAALVVVAVALVVWDPIRFPPLLTALVGVALALNVAATLALQADLGLGRAGAWCARYPAQNAVLIVATFVLYEAAGVTGAVAAIALAGVVAFALGAVAVTPLLRRRLAPVELPEGSLRFSFLQASGGVLAQYAQRGGVLAVALLAGSSLQTGYAALAIGAALAATYAVVQIFTVSLPRLTERSGIGTLDESGSGGAASEAVLRRLAGYLLAVLLPAAVLAVVLLDVAVPIVFGADYVGGVPAFVPAVAMVLLAPLNALTIQAAALRTRPEVTLYAALAGAVVFTAVALLTVEPWGAVGATFATLAAAAASAVVAILMLPGAVGARIAVVSIGGAVAVTGWGLWT